LDALYGEIGIDFAKAAEGAYYTLETHIRHFREARLGTALVSQTEILGYDEKRLHLLHRLFDDAGGLLATGEHLAIHVAHGRSCAAAQAVLDRIRALFAPYQDIPVEEGTGSVLLRPLRVSRPSKPVF
jgi:acyl-CoA thioester hydrolase/carnitine 3-dehydrogenase